MPLDIYSERGEGGGESHRRSLSPQVLQEEHHEGDREAAGGSQQASDQG